MAAAIGLLIGIAIGLFAGYKIWHEEPRSTTETVRQGRVQADGSVLVTRVPMADPGKAPHILPKGSKEERRVQVMVKPLAAPIEDPAAKCSCEPVMVDLSLIRDRDGTGIVASSENGEVLMDGTIDIPMIDPPEPKRGFAMATAEPGRDNYTLSIGKTYMGDRVMIGIGAMKIEGRSAGPALSIGFKW